MSKRPFVYRDHTEALHRRARQAEHIRAWRDNKEASQSDADRKGIAKTRDKALPSFLPELLDPRAPGANRGKKR